MGMRRAAATVARPAKTSTFLPHENPEDFATLLNGLEDEFQPESASEKSLITEMARAQWKLGRIEAIEAVGA
jgi:hypothetical protein